MWRVRASVAMEGVNGKTEKKIGIFGDGRGGQKLMWVFFLPNI